MNNTERKIKTICDTIDKIMERLNSLEVKNDSDKLHKKRSKALRDHGTLLTKDKDGSEWINLDIDNLPERFFTRDDIEIDGQHPLTSIWISLENYSEDARKGVLNLSKLWGIKYRYRIIQEKKEPMKMNRKALWAIYKAETGKLAMQSTNKNAFRDLIFESFSKVDFTNIYVSFNGEKVEIID